MSASTYYNFINPATEKVSLKQDVAVANSSDSIDSNRHTGTSPESYATSPTNSNSSLNRLNASTPTSNASSLTAFSSSSASSTNSMATTSAMQPSIASQQQTPTKVAPRKQTSSSLNNNNNLVNNENDEHGYVVSQEQQNRHCDLQRKLSITPTSMLSSISNSKSFSHHGHSQLTHSYTLHSLEPRPLKPFKSRDAYIEAMKEDLSEWLNRLYTDLELTPDDFFSQLESGSIICRHANNVTQMGRNSMLEQVALDNNGAMNGDNSLQCETNYHPSNTNHNNSIDSPSTPESDDNHQRQLSRHQIILRDNSTSHPLSQRHRHSTANSSISSITTNSSSTSSKQRFSLTGSGPLNLGSLSPRFNDNRQIDWFRVRVISYKPDARPGTFFARDNICQFIHWCRTLNVRECLLFETDDLVARKNEKSFILCLLEVARIGFKVGMPTPLIIQLEQEIDREIENDAKLEEENAAKVINSEYGSVSSDTGGSDHDPKRYNDDNNNGLNANTDATSNNRHCANEFLEQSKADENKELDGEDCQQDYGPKPQVITNDLLSLHEKVVQLLCQCTCPTQFPMVRIGDGKYRVGDKLVIFVRILRRHIMVRVGGGWQELSDFLRQKDPCRINKHHHQLLGSSLTYEHVTTTSRSSLTPTPPTATVTPTNANNRNDNRLKGTPSTRIPKLANFPSASRSRLIGSNNHLDRSYRRVDNSGQELISGSISMSWLSNK